ncbi:hypothetical protein [Spirosoma pomorum]
MTKLFLFFLIPLAVPMAVLVGIALAIGLILTAILAPVFDAVITNNPPKYYEYTK